MTNGTNNLQQHPFLNGSSNNYLLKIPPQMISLSKKNDLWKEKTMDAFETIGRNQWLSNQKLYDNYKLANGEFIHSEYMSGGNDYKDPLSKLSEDFDIPSFIKNYDICSQPINSLVGEMDLQPDVFTVVGKGEIIEGETMRIKSKMIHDFQMKDIENKINIELINKGLDPNFNDFESEEEKQEYLNTIQNEKNSAKDLLQIQDWIDRNYKHMAVQWGEIELEDQKERFNLIDLKRVEFKDFLCIGKRFRCIYLKPNSFGVRSCNPINVFFHKSPDLKFIQDGDYVGEIYILSLSDVIDRFGFRMNKTQLESLENCSLSKDEKDVKSKIDYLSPTGIPYGQFVPTLDKNINSVINNSLLNTPIMMNESILDSINGNSLVHSYNGMFQVTEAYWKTFKKIGKLYHINFETGLAEKILIDENYILPDYVKEKSGLLNFDDEEDEINTITWSYVPEVWSGVKINNAGVENNLKSPIYINIGKHDIQFKGESIMYSPKLPICGQVINNRNTVSTSLIDLLKPYQFFYNVLMNQSYNFLEKEIMPFLLMDVNLIPNDKDWGNGKGRSLEKWMNVAKSFGIVPADTSPENALGANSNGHLPRIIDMDMSNRMLSRFNMAQQIKMLALEQIGISNQRLGNIKSTETATGINQATQNSSIQTSFWFNEFFACERDILKMQLSIAQVLQSKNKDILATATKSDLSNTFLKFTDDDFMLHDLHVYISNSQKDIRNLELVRRFAIENNTIGSKLSDRITMATSNSIPSIMEIIKKTEKELEERQNKEFALKQQELNQNKELVESQNIEQKEQFYAKLQNDLSEAYIKANGFNENLSSDSNNNTIPDVLEQLKFIEKQESNLSKLEISKQKIDNEKETTRLQQNYLDRQLAFNEQKESNKLILEKEKLKRAKIQGDKSK